MDYKYKITVFTPTYNRAYILHNLYQSLKRQATFDFEWLIVDDGSTDNTQELVNSWKKSENNFPIRYFKKENGGKCRAINYALDRAEGKLFFTVDSDDYLTNDALIKIIKWEAEISYYSNYCGVAGNIGTSEQETNNQTFEKGFYDGTLLDRYKNVDGERAIALYTDIHKKYKYPEFQNEKFMTEAVVWNRMAHDGYRMRFYNDIIWIYEYRSDGLTQAGNNLFINNPRGYALWLKERTIFEGVTLRKLFLFYYSMYAELKKDYGVNSIAEFVHTSNIIIWICSVVYKVKHKKQLG